MNSVNMLLNYMIESNRITDNIYEAYNNGRIDDEDASYLLERVNYVLEKKTQEEYARRKFRKKYDYDPKTKTIKIDNKRVEVDDGKGRSMKSQLNDEEISVPRQTSVTITGDRTMIGLDKYFFRLKGQKRRDAILQHEIGHSKLHQTSGNNNMIDRGMASKQYIYNNLIGTLVSNGAAENRKVAGQFVRNDPGMKAIIDKYVSDIKKHGDTDAKRSKLRSEALRIFRKYEKGGHINDKEFEADRYAANKSGTKYISRGLKNLYKETRRDVKEYKKLLKSYKSRDREKLNKEIHRVNTDIENDLQARTKLLKKNPLSLEQSQNYK